MNNVKIMLCGSFSFLLFATAPFYAGTTAIVENELLEACRADDFTSVKEISRMPGVDVNASDEYGNTPLLIAVQRFSLDLVDELLNLQKSDGSFAVNVNQSNLDGTTPLLAACQNSDRLMVDRLVKVAGIGVNLADKDGNTPLLIAVQRRNLDLIDALLSLQKSDGSFAVNVNQSNLDGTTPLLAACQDRNFLMVDRLLKVAGIDVNLADKDGNTPLLVACRPDGMYLNFLIIAALLKNEASNKANNQGETPLELTRDTLIHAKAEFYLLGEVQASRWCNPLSAKECKYYRERDFKRAREAKEGIPFHE